MLTLKCCAVDCQSDTQKTPSLKFFNLTTGKASLTEWLLAINRPDVLADLTVGESVSSYNICELHFPGDRRTSPDPSDAPLSLHNVGNGRIISCKSEGSQTPATFRDSKASYMLTQSPVEIVDIQPEPTAPQLMHPSILTNFNPLIPSFVPQSVLRTDTIGEAFTAVNPMLQTNNASMSTFVAPLTNAVEQNIRPIKIGIPRLTSDLVERPSVNTFQRPRRYVIKKLVRPRIMQVYSNADNGKYHSNPVISNPQPTANTHLTQATAANEHMAAVNVTMFKYGTSYTGSRNLDSEKVTNNTNFTRPGVDNLQQCKFLTLPNSHGNIILKLPSPNELIKTVTADHRSEQPAEVAIIEDSLTGFIAKSNSTESHKFNERKAEFAMVMNNLENRATNSEQLNKDEAHSILARPPPKVSDFMNEYLRYNFNIMKEADVDTSEADIDITEDTLSKVSTDTNQDEFKSGSVQLAFPASEHNYALQNVDNGEHYHKFEVDESGSDNLETYCFLDDEDSAKRRKVETPDSDFKMIKLEIDSDHDDT